MDKNKKGLSTMIGYVLLITLAIVMSVFIYQWMQSYVPKKSIDCPDGVAVYLKDYSCDRETLNITVKNKGRYSVAGFYVYAVDSNGKQTSLGNIENNDIEIINKGDSIIPAQGAIRIYQEVEGDSSNTFKPGTEVKVEFDISAIEEIKTLKISPGRNQETDGEKIFSSCENELIKEEISC